MTTVLLVEDDERISEPLIRVLRAEGFEVVHVAAGQPALVAVATARPDLVLLDLTLPDIDGLDVCRKLRADHPDLPVIMLTARAEEMDVIVGLNAGADDYVAKPFRLAELVARIRARLRISESTAGSMAAPTTLTGAGIELDLRARRCRVADPAGAGGTTEIELTSKEFDLLAMLMQQPGVTLTRDCDHEHRVGRELVGVDPHPRHAHLDPAPQDQRHHRPAVEDRHRQRCRIPLRTVTGHCGSD